MRRHALFMGVSANLGSSRGGWFPVDFLFASGGVALQ